LSSRRSNFADNLLFAFCGPAIPLPLVIRCQNVSW
jgi:hypothetical protein